ncbi:reverse transcriptase domain-containing protein [Tanacetum coccineum]
MRTHGAISAVLLTDRDSVNQSPVLLRMLKALKERRSTIARWRSMIWRSTLPPKDCVGTNCKSGASCWGSLTFHYPDQAPQLKRSDIGGFSHSKNQNRYVSPERCQPPEPWILFTDGSSCVDGSGAGLILTNPEGMEFTYALRFEFTATNNEAEYEALLAGLRIAARMGVRNLEANVDSRLVANHVLGEYVAKEDNMLRAPIKAGIGRNLEEQIHLGDGDIYGDRRTGSHVDDPYRGIHKHGHAPSGTKGCPAHTPYRAEIRTSRGCPLSTFVPTAMAPARALRLGIWATSAPRTRGDMIRKCKDCQVHRPIPRQPQQELAPITSPWPFHKWGIDIAGPFPAAAGGLKFLIVAIDYFTKWIEAKAVATITGNQDGSRYTSRLGMPTIRTAEVNITTNDDERRIDLDILEERREQAAIREEKAKKARRPCGEGTLEVTEALGKGAYKLRETGRRELTASGHICNLKKCYFSEGFTGLNMLFTLVLCLRGVHALITPRMGKG